MVRPLAVAAALLEQVVARPGVVPRGPAPVLAVDSSIRPEWVSPNWVRSFLANLEAPLKLEKLSCKSSSFSSYMHEMMGISPLSERHELWLVNWRLAAGM